MKLTPGERIFFTIVTPSALWVGAWSYVEPALVQNGIPWFAPPLHARVIGALYLSAFVFCFMSIFARNYAQIRIVLPMIAIWTAITLVVSLFYLTGTDLHQEPIWIWIGANSMYAVIALWLMWVHIGVADPAGADLSIWVRLYFLVQALVLIAASLVMLALPDMIVKIWPWELTSQLSRIYGGPLLGYGVASLKLARARGYSEARIPVAGMLVFASAVLAASAIERATFASESISMTIWFASFAVVAAILGLVLIRAWLPAAAR